MKYRHFFAVKTVMQQETAVLRWADILREGEYVTKAETLIITATYPEPERAKEAIGKANAIATDECRDKLPIWAEYRYLRTEPIDDGE